MLPMLIVMSGSSPSGMNIVSSLCYSTRMIALVERAHGFDEHNHFSLLHTLAPCFVLTDQAHWREQARPDMGESLLPFPICPCSTYPPRQYSYGISSYGTTWFLADYKRCPGDGAQCQVGLSSE